MKKSDLFYTAAFLLLLYGAYQIGQMRVVLALAQSDRFIETVYMRHAAESDQTEAAARDARSA